jgi:hypothetical protein
MENPFYLNPFTIAQLKGISPVWGFCWSLTFQNWSNDDSCPGLTNPCCSKEIELRESRFVLFVFSDQEEKLAENCFSVVFFI